jgi:hypothetical protein
MAWKWVRSCLQGLEMWRNLWENERTCLLSFCLVIVFKFHLKCFRPTPKLRTGKHISQPPISWELLSFLEPEASFPVFCLTNWALKLLEGRSNGYSDTVSPIIHPTRLRVWIWSGNCSHSSIKVSLIGFPSVMFSQSFLYSEQVRALN